ncbi:MAG: TetR/AcrR family transcriptional regulator [Chloroflexi bacterium]|nr:TetR/AcrR family transcriptional regulator [Chloroflexota bacterium]
MPYPAQTDYQTIVQTARTLIEQEGLEQLSLARLAATLGIKAPSLYGHIANKSALLKAVIVQTYELLFAAYSRALSEAGDDPKARLLALLRAHRAFAHANPSTYMLAFTTTAPEQRMNQQALEQLALPIQELMAALVGAERSLTALRGALALVHGFVMLELNEQLQRGGDLSAAFDESIQAYLSGWQRSA